MNEKKEELNGWEEIPICNRGYQCYAEVHKDAIIKALNKLPNEKYINPEERLLMDSLKN